MVVSNLTVFAQHRFPRGVRFRKARIGYRKIFIEYIQRTYPEAHLAFFNNVFSLILKGVNGRTVIQQAEIQL